MGERRPVVIDQTTCHVAGARNAASVSLAELFRSDVFDDRAMRTRLPASVYESLCETMNRGSALDPRLADIVANAMKEWAVERGATHFSHWFQPMTGHTAEKHDAFLSFSGDQPVVEFSGKALVKGEPDASSFPSGGIRSTFEARGYTAWDPTSPAFIRRGTRSSTLCIPTAFCSWTGEALDTKTPLLRSSEALSREAVRLLHVLGRTEVRQVFTTLGSEQEYFLIDRRYFVARPDLVACGRTLMGARPAKGQELEDHYFGTISDRVLAYMEDCEEQLWRLGVPVKTRHNEVAPGQFELAPIFERTSVAVDHNMLTMDVLRKTALQHGLVCLLHEKPFAGVNGSGKHNNWSMATDAGENLLEPGTDPGQNARFVVVLTAVLRAVDIHADLLRAAIATPGNDHRLGANEAPPAIISAYLGGELDEVCRGLIAGSVQGERKGTQAMRLGVTSLPPLPRDSTDRNRTSSFAFTGNKFEFRAVGSSQSCAGPNIALNTIAAESFRHMANRIEELARKSGLEAAVQQVVQEELKQHYRVVFNGNGYGAEWQVEAEKRGLPNMRNTVDALEHSACAANVELFESMGVFTRRELESRATIAIEHYEKHIAIEAQACLDIAATMVVPSALQMQQRVASSVSAARTADSTLDLAPQEALLKSISNHVSGLLRANAALEQVTGKVDSVGHGEHGIGRAAFIRDQVVPAMARVRELCDALEACMDDELWPLPKYREMLFVH
ncbi:MAG: glutamine synthetase type III [Planctomycetes bacterium]|nr:glutamine synthetase type III [Planctomycetota bacterium]